MSIVQNLQKQTFKLSKNKKCCSYQNLKADDLLTAQPSNNQVDTNTFKRNSLLPTNSNPVKEEIKLTHVAPNACCSYTSFNFHDEQSDEKVCCGGVLIDTNKNLDCCLGVVYETDKYACEEDSGYVILRN